MYSGTHLGGGLALLAINQLRLLLNCLGPRPSNPSNPPPAERGASQLSRPAWRRVRGRQLQHRSCSLLLSTPFIRPPFPSVIPPSSLCQWTGIPPTPPTLSSPLCPVSCGRANGISLFLPSRPPLKDFESVICLFSFLFYLYLYPHLRVKTAQ